MASMICFGDSITRGESDADYGGWADRIKTRLIKQFVETGKDKISVSLIWGLVVKRQMV
ncbi:hypothetical protein ACPSKX_17695 [Moritella viscosa]